MSTEDIAATAARIVVEEGLEYGQAKRRAVKQLGLGNRAPLPDNDQVESAVFEYLSIFCADTQPAELRALAEVERLALDLHRTAEAAVHRVVFQQVGVGLDRAGGVDLDDLNVVARGFGDMGQRAAADAAKAIDADGDGHVRSPDWAMRGAIARTRCSVGVRIPWHARPENPSFQHDSGNIAWLR